MTKKDMALPQGDRATTPDGAEPVVSGKAGIPSAGQTYRSQGVQMYADYHPDAAGDPTIEVWAFRGCEDDPDHGEGHLEIYVHEIVPTKKSGTLAVYYRQWFNPEGERLWSRKRVVGNLASLKAVISRRKMTAQAIEAGTAETGTGSVHESAVPQECAQGDPHAN